MTRRRFLFVDHENHKLALTTEYNGDRSQFLAIGSQDSCDKDWSDMEREFLNCWSISQFEEEDRRCQGYYHSFLGQTEYEPLTILEDGAEAPSCEVSVLWCGSLYPADSQTLHDIIHRIQGEQEEESGENPAYLQLLDAFLADILKEDV